jgi:hypothetical protein
MRAVNTKRELYYISKGEIKHNSGMKPLDFADQNESDDIIDFICELLECYREELNCYANDRGGQTYSQQLVVTETLPDGDKAIVDLSKLGTTPFQPKNRPQNLKLSARKKIDFCLIVESEGTANTLVANGFTKRHACILMGAQGVPSNAVRGWCKLIQDQLTQASNMTDRLAALSIMNVHQAPGVRDALQSFYKDFEHEALVIDKWFTLQATSFMPNTFATVQKLMSHPAFDMKNMLGIVLSCVALAFLKVIIATY